jgi:hypothetical protein
LSQIPSVQPGKFLTIPQQKQGNPTILGNIGLLLFTTDVVSDNIPVSGATVQTTEHKRGDREMTINQAQAVAIEVLNNDNAAVSVVVEFVSTTTQQTMYATFNRNGLQSVASHQ